MNSLNIGRERIYNQRILRSEFFHPHETLVWLGAMQAQDYRWAKWALGLRTTKRVDQDIEKAVLEKSILRTWLMRGTLHFAAARDVNWMLELLAPRIISGSARRYKQLELDSKTFTSSFEILTKLLQGNRHMLRAEIFLELDKRGVSVQGQRGYHILRRAALEGLICYGPPQDKQETFMLLEESGGESKHLEGEQALAELARRYFQSRGPAELEDFIWWSGLTAAQAHTGLELIKPELVQNRMGKRVYWNMGIKIPNRLPASTAVLLPPYDEYILGYRNREPVLNPKYDAKAVSNNGVFRPVMVIDGQVMGTWKSKSYKDSVSLTLNLFESVSEAQTPAVEEAVIQFSKFLDLPVKVM